MMSEILQSKLNEGNAEYPEWVPEIGSPSHQRRIWGGKINLRYCEVCESSYVAIYVLPIRIMRKSYSGWYCREHIPKVLHLDPDIWLKSVRL